MVSGNEFSTFGLNQPPPHHLLQTDSYYLLRDPEARVANYTPHNSPNQWKKTEKKNTASHFYGLSVSEDRAACLSVCLSVCECVCVTEKGGRKKERDWNETILPLCQIRSEHSCHFTPCRPTLFGRLRGGNLVLLRAPWRVKTLRRELSPPKTNPMSEFPHASVCECYENTCPYA